MQVLFDLFVLTRFIIYLLITKNEKLKKLHAALTKLKQSFNELDEQAKIIVKTDLEHNRTQEELDKR